LFVIAQAAQRVHEAATTWAQQLKAHVMIAPMFDALMQQVGWAMCCQISALLWTNEPHVFVIVFVYCLLL
jgi:hypothetical protein